MSASCSVYFNYRDLVTSYGGQKASRIASSHINNIFSELTSASATERTKEAFLVSNDGLEEIEPDSYGAIAVFTYSSTKSSENAAMSILDWITQQNQKLSMKLPILGIIHSKSTQILSCECASNIFRLSLSFNPTIFCLDGNAFPKHPKIQRMVINGGCLTNGHILCSRNGPYFVVCDVTGVRMINKDTAVRLTEEAIDKSLKTIPTVIYSYDGGNVLYDCEFVSYLKSLLALADSRHKNVIISSDIKAFSNKISEAYTSKVILCNILSYSQSKKVTFDETEQPKARRDQYINKDKLF
jgi:hypothetical protein